jgi:hypothetical protein
MEENTNAAGERHASFLMADAIAERSSPNLEFPAPVEPA